MKTEPKALIAAATAVVFVIAGPTVSAWAFGSINYFGQNAEHQHITEAIRRADPRWQVNSFAMLAGKNGNMGGVAAPDRPMDSGGITKGSGPGYKHCDGGDYLSTPGYEQSRDAARAELESCARYFQTLMGRAVRYSGKLVSADLVVDRSVFKVTSVPESSFSPNDICAYSFSLEPDTNAKCDVMNAFGRALHLAEDVYAHSNWADVADPTKPTGPQNPPGLGMTTIPEFLRYPGQPTIPDGLISGCDDTPSGPSDCPGRGRVAHSMLAKDNGSFTLTTFSPTDKYPRGQVKVNGVTNFERAIRGAWQQADTSWQELQSAIIAKYGRERGDLIITTLISDRAPASTVGAADISGSPEASESASMEPSPVESVTDETPDSPSNSTSATPTPEASAMSPEASAMSPEASAMSPEASAMSPEASAMSPEASAMSPEASAMSPEASAMSPAEPSRMAGAAESNDNSIASSQSSGIVLGLIALAGLVAAVAVLLIRRRSNAHGS